VRGGVSPVGMKKLFPTYIDSSADALDEIAVSAGQRGLQILIDPKDLKNYINAAFADLTKE